MVRAENMVGRVRSSLARWVSAVLFASVIACGTGGGENDASGNGGSDGGSPGCDPVAQSGCVGGQKCSLACNGAVPALACLPENGTVAVGQACTDTNQCLGGAFCASSASIPTPTCVKLCSTTADCPSGTCQSLPVTLPLCRQPVMVSLCN
jgi:hypothetical protein